MGPEIVFGCIACIAVGVGVIMYVLLRTPKKPASIGDVPSIDLGDEVPKEPSEDEATEDEATEDEVTETSEDEATEQTESKEA
jgi:hypothetical protein